MSSRTLRSLAALAVLLVPTTLAACGGDDDAAAPTTTETAASDAGSGSSSDDPTADLEPEGDSSQLVPMVEEQYPGVPADQIESGAADVCTGIKDQLLMDDLVTLVVEKFGGDGRPDPTVEQAESIIAIVRLTLDGC